jgi:hypothetical protein
MNLVEEILESSVEISPKDDSINNQRLKFNSRVC